MMCLEVRTLALDLHPISAERIYSTLTAPAMILAPSALSLLFEILRLVTSLSEEPCPLFVSEELSILLLVIEGTRGARGAGEGRGCKCAEGTSAKEGRRREGVNFKRNAQREATAWKKRGAMHMKSRGETARQESHLVHEAHHFGRKDATFLALSVPNPSPDRSRLPLGSSKQALSFSSRTLISTIGT